MVGVHNGLALIVRDQAQLPTGTQCKFVFHKASHTLRLYILKLPNALVVLEGRRQNCQCPLRCKALVLPMARTVGEFGYWAAMEAINTESGPAHGRDAS
jgi:hypothetical protein